MTKDFNNKDNVSMENAFFEENTFGIYGWYGLEYFELLRHEDGYGFTNLDRESFLKLYNLMTEMKKEVDRLENL